MCYLRRRFEEKFADCTGGSYIGDTGAFYFDNIGAEDVKLFLLKQTYNSFLFLSETMDIFCRAGSVQQAQQSTHLAEGLSFMGLTHCNRPPSGAVEMATVTSVPVLLFKMRCMFFFTVKTCLCALSEESTLSFPSLSANPFSIEAPYIPHHDALPSQTVFDFLSQRHNRLCHFISDLMDY